jgi:hypothetical protein
MPHAPVTPNGDEGAMANSPHGDIYDVIVPNAPSGPVSIDALNSYKVTVMLGKYPKSKALAERLMEYVKAGGTLLINIKQVNEFFPASFLGFERTNFRGTIEVKRSVRATTGGQTFALYEGYECEAIKLDGALPLLEDASGNILACKNIFGKGHVIVSTVDFLVPRNYMHDQRDVLGKLAYGKDFPFIEYFLSNVEKEVLPLEVRGDIQYGINKLNDGWLLYLINNKGVTKFTNKEQTLDMSKTAKVVVSLRDINASAITELRGHKALQKDVGNNSFTVIVPPGDIKICKITNAIEKEK